MCVCVCVRWHLLIFLLAQTFNQGNTFTVLIIQAWALLVYKESQWTIFASRFTVRMYQEGNSKEEDQAVIVPSYIPVVA